MFKKTKKLISHFLISTKLTSQLLFAMWLPIIYLRSVWKITVSKLIQLFIVPALPSTITLILFQYITYIMYSISTSFNCKVNIAYIIEYWWYNLQMLIYYNVLCLQHLPDALLVKKNNIAIEKRYNLCWICFQNI